MTSHLPETSLHLRSLIKAGGELELSLVELPVPALKAHEVLIQVEAAPLNPSDLGMLLGPADVSVARESGTPDRPVLTAPVPAVAMAGLKGRWDVAMPVGNEGAGLVVAAGASDAAQALLGRRVAAIGGGMYAQYRAVSISQCLRLPDDASAVDGASCFVNPLTALGMVDTMRREGHQALVHTAAASNLGQMLQRICTQDDIGLVNIVRSQPQVDLLRAHGAKHVCNLASPSFIAELTVALEATGATLAFDATGGGVLAGQILSCMEAALGKAATAYSRYGSTTHKQVYLYGGLDPSPVSFKRDFGMAWGMGGWLLFTHLQKIGAEATEVMKQRVARELKTTFKSHYAHQIALADLLRVSQVQACAKPRTGEKFLLLPNAVTA